MHAAHKKTIFITDSYALNIGDAAILLATVDAIRRETDFKIIVESSHPKRIVSYSELNGVAIFPRIFDFQTIVPKKGAALPLTVIFFGLVDSFSFLLWAALFRWKNILFFIRPERRAQAQALATSDVLVSIGGGFLSSRYAYGFRLYMIVLGALLQKKVVLLGQSIGPFETFFSRILIPTALNRVSCILAREPNTIDLLRAYDIHAPIVPTADMAYLLPEAKQITAVTAPGKLVALCLKSGGDEFKNRRHKKIFGTVIEYLRRNDYSVILVSHTVADDVFLEDLGKLFDNKIDIVRFGTHPATLVSLYGQCEFIISELMHALIFASTRATPFIAIGDAPKFVGLARMLDYDSSYVFSVEDEARPGFEDVLLTAIDRLRAEREQQANRLKEKAAAMKIAAHRNIEILEQILR